MVHGTTTWCVQLRGLCDGRDSEDFDVPYIMEGTSRSAGRTLVVSRKSLCPGPTEHCRAAGFTLIELMIVVAIIIVLSGIAIPYGQAYISSQRLQEVAWQLVEDLRTVREAAILYQQDLNDVPELPTTPLSSRSRHRTPTTRCTGSRRSSTAWTRQPRYGGITTFPVTRRQATSHRGFSSTTWSLTASPPRVPRTRLRSAARSTSSSASGPDRGVHFVERVIG